MRRGWPLALTLSADRVPIVFHALRSAMTQAGSPDPRNDPVCIMSSCPRQLILPTYLITVSHAAINSVGSLYLSPRTIMAHAIRAILLASATAATLIGRLLKGAPTVFLPGTLTDFFFADGAIREDQLQKILDRFKLFSLVAGLLG